MALSARRAAGSLVLSLQTAQLVRHAAGLRGIITDAFVADWVEMTGSEQHELIIEDGKGAQVSPIHDIPTFARQKAIRSRFPTMVASGRCPMIVNATVVGQRKDASMLEVDTQRAGNPIVTRVMPDGSPAYLTVPHEADVAMVGQTFQPLIHDTGARAWAAAELSAFAAHPRYLGGALEVGGVLDAAAEQLRAAWSSSALASDVAEPDAAAAYPGYARQYGAAATAESDAALAAEAAERGVSFDAAALSSALRGLGSAQDDLEASLRHRAGAAAALASRRASSGGGSARSAVPAASPEHLDAALAAAGAVFGTGLQSAPHACVGSAGSGLRLLDVTMESAKPGTVREYAVIGAVAVLHGRLGGRGVEPPRVEWVLLGAALPAFEHGTEAAERDAAAAGRSGLSPQWGVGASTGAAESREDGDGGSDSDSDAASTSSGRDRDREGASVASGAAVDTSHVDPALRALVMADPASAVHDAASLFVADVPAELSGAGSVAPTWDTAAAAAAAAAREGSVTASSATDDLLLRARIETLTRWLEACALGLEHEPDAAVGRVASPAEGSPGVKAQTAPVVFGAAVAQALVFAHRAAWWRMSVARPLHDLTGSDVQGYRGMLRLGQSALWLPDHVSEGTWHPRGVTEPHPIAALEAARRATAQGRNWLEASREHFEESHGGTVPVDESAAKLWEPLRSGGSVDTRVRQASPTAARHLRPEMGLGGATNERLLVAHYSRPDEEPLEAWQEEAFVRVLRERQQLARRMEERPEPSTTPDGEWDAHDPAPYEEGRA